MSDKPVLFTTREHTGYITLNRPETGNRLDLAMAQELAEVCAEINGDTSIYLAVITGSGDAFCSGVEQSVYSSFAGWPDGCSPSGMVAGLDCPVLAVINGEALGEGLELALACDLRIASDKANFGLPQIVEGHIPLDGGTQRLPRIVGKGKAMELILTGDIIDAITAGEIGLVNKVVAHDRLRAEAEALVENLRNKASFAMRYCKEAVNKGLDLALDQGLRLEADLYFLLHTTADRTEGIKSFLQKRPPEYQGK